MTLCYNVRSRVTARIAYLDNISAREKNLYKIILACSSEASMSSINENFFSLLIVTLSLSLMNLLRLRLYFMYTKIFTIYQLEEVNLSALLVEQ